jgi:uncharacterized protein
MRSFISTALVVCYSFFSYGQDITGTWQGNIAANGQQILIVFHFYKDSAGILAGRWDCPPQNARNLPCSDVKTINDSVIVGLKVISGSYEGHFIRKDSIAGTWHQGAAALPLNISRSHDATAFVLPARPQTPKPPYPYLAKELVYTNADKTMKYGATLTIPSSASGGHTKYPAVLLITGSGKQDRDEDIFDHKPFAVIADYLTRRGIAVLRVDDRGMGQTTGNFDTSSSEDFANDVEAGIKYLQSREDIDTRHLGLLGHSEGGMIAPMVAARNNGVSFIVMLAGPGVTGMVINDYQNTLPLRSEGMSPAIIQSFLDLHHQLVKAAISAQSIPDYNKEVATIYTGWKKTQSPESLAALAKSPDDETIPVLQEKYGSFRSKWWRFFLVHDPAADLEKLQVPVLALNGEKDLQVDAAINLPAVEAALTKSGSKNIKTMLIPGLNHLFQHCKLCTIGEYGDLEETFSTGVLKIIGDWITAVVAK